MNTKNPIEGLLDSMSLEEQASLLSGADFWTPMPIPRLDVPAVKVTDGPNGARGGIFKDGPSTACFPVGIALATGAALGREARLKSARVLLAPTVVQLYLAPLADAPKDSMARPPQSLVGFCRLALAAGTSGTARMAIAARAFESFDTDVPGWVARPGIYELRAAASSRDIKLRVELQHE